MKTQIDFKSEGTIDPTDRVRMTFDSESITHLMGILTDLYSDPAMAVIREISTNAWDSHQAAGNTDPIQVWGPSALNPMFVVKDNGIGMDANDINQHFSKYGWSSKRDTDSQAGMLGLGCKAPLTYTSQFTLVAIKNSMQYTVLVTRENDGTGAVQIMDVSPTSEPNGVEVRVPVSKVGDFNAKIKQFFRFWQPGSVLVNGVTPSFEISDKTIVLSDDITLYYGLDNDYVVMGNVPYPVEEVNVDSYGYRMRRNPFGLPSGYRAVITVPIGAVNFTPSREALQMTKRTTELIAATKARIVTLLTGRAQAEMDKAANHAEALEWIDKWEIFSPNLLTYKGEAIPQRFTPSGDIGEYIDPPRMHAWGITRRTDTQASRVISVDRRNVKHACFVTGYKRNGLTSDCKAKIQAWIARDHPGSDTFKAFVSDKPLVNGHWLQHRPHITWSELQKIPYDGEVKRGRDAPEPVYKVLNSHGDIYLTPRADLPTDKPVIYVKSEERKSWGERVNSYLAPTGDRVTVVLLGKNQVNKFLTDYPETIHLSEWIKEQTKTFLTGLSDRQLFALKGDSAYRDLSLTDLNLSEVLDPELRSLVHDYKVQDTTVNVSYWSYLENACSYLEIAMPIIPDTKFKDRIDQIQKRYPLLGKITGSWHFKSSLVKQQALTDYVNAIYMKNTLKLV